MRLKPLYRQILCYETLKVRMAEFSILPADKGNEMQCAEPNVHYPLESIWVGLDVASKISKKCRVLLLKIICQE